MVSCTINGMLMIYPSAWDELKPSQLMAIASGFVKGLSISEFRINTMLNFIGLKTAVKNSVYLNGEHLYELKANGNKKVFLSGAQLLEMADKLSFITKEIKDENDKPVYALESKLTKNLVPHFRCRLRKYYGPSDNLFNIILAEYITAEIYFNEYVKTNDPLALDKLVATLYRKRSVKANPRSVNYRGDMRRKFNDHLIERHARRFKNLPPEIKTSIALYYEGCRAFLQRQFPDVFKSASSGRRSGVDGMLALVDALSGGDVTKTESVRTSYLYDVMVHLQKAVEAQEEAKQKMKKK